MLFVAGLLAALTGVLGHGGASSPKRSPRRFNGGGLHRSTSKASSRLAALTGVVGAISNVANDTTHTQGQTSSSPLKRGRWGVKEPGRVTVRAPLHQGE